MRDFKLFIALFTVGILALGAGVALASEEAAKVAGPTALAAETTRAPEGQKARADWAAWKVLTRRVSGVVTAVEPDATPPTMVVKVTKGNPPLTVGVDVPAKAIIRQGQARMTLSDITVGDRVWMKYKRTSNHLIAEDIHILKPHHVAAKG